MQNQASKNTTTKIYQKKSLVWISKGIFWGLSIFLFICIAIPLLQKESISIANLFYKLALSIVSGLVFGIVAYLYNKNKQ